VVDLLSAALYLYKGLEPTAILYALYAVIALFGYRNWKKMIVC
jgi:nicotinamide mononucleotide transporter